LYFVPSGTIPPLLTSPEKKTLPRAVFHSYFFHPFSFCLSFTLPHQSRALTEDCSCRIRPGICKAYFAPLTLTDFYVPSTPISFYDFMVFSSSGGFQTFFIFANSCSGGSASYSSIFLSGLRSLLIDPFGEQSPTFCVVKLSIQPPLLTSPPKLTKSCLLSFLLRLVFFFIFDEPHALSSAATCYYLSKCDLFLPLRRVFFPSIALAFSSNTPFLGLVLAPPEKTEFFSPMKVFFETERGTYPIVAKLLL